jgi:hypothetical protein
VKSDYGANAHVHAYSAAVGRHKCSSPTTDARNRSNRLQAMRAEIAASGKFCCGNCGTDELWPATPGSLAKGQKRVQELCRAPRQRYRRLREEREDEQKLWPGAPPGETERRNVDLNEAWSRKKCARFINLALALWPNEMCNYKTEMFQRQRNWEVRMTYRLKITSVGLFGLLLLNLIALVLNLSQSSKAAVGGMEYEDLMRDSDFTRAVKSIAQKCTVNVDLAKLKC